MTTHDAYTDDPWNVSEDFTASPDDCPACGDPVDYCQGHGPVGDPDGYAALVAAGWVDDERVTRVMEENNDDPEFDVWSALAAIDAEDDTVPDCGNPGPNCTEHDGSCD